MAEMLSEAHRIAVLTRLAAFEAELADISRWLDSKGAEKPAILIEDCWRNILAAQTLLSRDPLGRSMLVQGRLTTMPPPNGAG